MYIYTYMSGVCSHNFGNTNKDNLIIQLFYKLLLPQPDQGLMMEKVMWEKIWQKLELDQPFSHNKMALADMNQHTI